MTTNDLKALRTKAGMTKAKWADALGVRWTTVHRWETGGSVPGEPTIRLMERVAREAASEGGN